MKASRKALFRALEKSDLHMLRAVLAGGESARLQEGDLRPPLMEAVNCNRNDLEILDALLAAGADINERDPYGGDSVLHWVTGRFTPAVLKWCLAHGANIHASNRNGWTPLFWAVRDANDSDHDPEYREYGLRDIALLLQTGAEVVHQDEKARTALHYTAEAGAIDTTLLLLDHGAPVDVRDATGATALMLAALHGHDALVTLLIDRGAQADSINMDGETALHFISKYPDRFTEHAAVAERLIAAGANPNKLNDDGFPPIYHCAGNGNIEMARLLLSHGADPNSGNGTVLWSAVFFEYDEIVSLLLGAGSEAGAVYDEVRLTALHAAAHEGYLFGAKALLAHGAPINAPDIDGETPLMVAARRQHINIVQALLDAGADVHHIDHYGNTALSLAKRHGNAELIALLDHRV